MSPLLGRSNLCKLIVGSVLVFWNSNMSRFEWGQQRSLLRSSVNNNEIEYQHEEQILIPAVLPVPPALQLIKRFTALRYEPFLTMPAGEQHYALLFYLTNTYGDDRPVIDIGTRCVASALALAAGGSPVHTFDLPDSGERFLAFRKKKENSWQEQVQRHGIYIRFFSVNLAEEKDMSIYLKDTWLISLDANHLPYSKPFERQWFLRLVEMGYKGLVLVRDIHAHEEMKKWWAELERSQKKLGFKAFDITHVGHSTGTGLLDFSGRVVVEDPVPAS
jgi:hypothetical protein